MTRLTWSDPRDRQFEAGLDRGVLYVPGTPEETPSDAMTWRPSGILGDENDGTYEDLYWSGGTGSSIFVDVLELAAPLSTYPLGSDQVYMYVRISASAPTGLDVYGSSTTSPETAFGEEHQWWASFSYDGSGEIQEIWSPIYGFGESIGWAMELCRFAHFISPDLTIHEMWIVADPTLTLSLSSVVETPTTIIGIPWNGLTSVDEAGGDSATQYYIDGRPFLSFPKPKEFAATIKAYTYPDEFSAVMGVAEAAPGMYLDSQLGDSFSLSYRTLIGDAVEGTSRGYKIHLVYNATVAPIGASYTTISDTTNPSEFQWEIQAVPVVIQGYRPTAHVVIDTRHMDPEKLAALEVLLYGDDVTTASLPDPQTIFDLLAFGDTIIITDLGDGKWTAEGAYRNVYMIGDGIFEIDNVIAVDHGDGTYSVSTTPPEI